MKKGKSQEVQDRLNELRKEVEEVGIPEKLRAKMINPYVNELGKEWGVDTRNLSGKINQVEDLLFKIKLICRILGQDLKVELVKYQEPKPLKRSADGTPIREFLFPESDKKNP